MGMSFGNGFRQVSRRYRFARVPELDGFERISQEFIPGERK